MKNAQTTTRHLRSARRSRGFTLIEIIVSLMIFSLVVVVALAALVKIIDANKRAQTIQDAVVNMSFTMDSMTRELRTGSDYYCRIVSPGTDLSVTSLSAQSVSGCSSVGGTGGGGVGFAFLSSRSTSGCRLITAYEVVPNMTGTGGTWSGTFAFNKAEQTSCNQSLAFSPIIDSASVSLTNYYLQIADTTFPLLFLKLDGIAGTKETVKTTFTLQTAASPRQP